MESKNKKEVNSNSGLPFIIIGIVLIVAVIGGWYLYSSSNKKTPVANGNTNRSTNAAQPQPNNTPLTSNIMGAQPPNFKGAQNSSVVIEEFADYQCPTCASMHPVMNEINSLYGSRIKFIYRNFPLAMHKNGYEASTSAEAAGLQGKFWDMQNVIFQNQKAWSNVDNVKPLFEGYAQTLGLDVEKFKTDVAGLAAKQRVDADMARGRSLNINSTPSILVNGVPVPFEQMSVDGIKKIVDAELAKTSGNQQSAPATSAPANAANTNPAK